MHRHNDTGQTEGLTHYQVCAAGGEIVQVNVLSTQLLNKSSIVHLLLWMNTHWTLHTYT